MSSKTIIQHVWCCSSQAFLETGKPSPNPDSQPVPPASSKLKVIHRCNAECIPCLSYPHPSKTLQKYSHEPIWHRHVVQSHPARDNAVRLTLCTPNFCDAYLCSQRCVAIQSQINAKQGETLRQRHVSELSNSHIASSFRDTNCRTQLAFGSAECITPPPLSSPLLTLPCHACCCESSLLLLRSRTTALDVRYLLM